MTQFLPFVSQIIGFGSVALLGVFLASQYNRPKARRLSANAAYSAAPVTSVSASTAAAYGLSTRRLARAAAAA